MILPGVKEVLNSLPFASLIGFIFGFLFRNIRVLLYSFASKVAFIKNNSRCKIPNLKGFFKCYEKTLRYVNLPCEICAFFLCFIFVLTSYIFIYCLLDGVVRIAFIFVLLIFFFIGKNNLFVLDKVLARFFSLIMSVILSPLYILIFLFEKKIF
jgi:hypothetical protein